MVLVWIALYIGLPVIPDDPRHGQLQQRMLHRVEGRREWDWAVQRPPVPWGSRAVHCPEPRPTPWSPSDPNPHPLNNIHAGDENKLHDGKRVLLPGVAGSQLGA